MTTTSFPPVNHSEFTNALKTLLNQFPNVDPALVKYVDQCTIDRNGFDFYSWNYWGKKSDGYSSISALAAPVESLYRKFTQLMKDQLMNQIEAELPTELKLTIGSKFKYNPEQPQNFVVLNMHRTGDSIVVYYIPEITRVANHSMFHYGLFRNYVVTELRK